MFHALADKYDGLLGLSKKDGRDKSCKGIDPMEFKQTNAAFILVRWNPLFRAP